MKKQILRKQVLSRIILCLILLMSFAFVPAGSANAEGQQNDTLPYNGSDVAGLLSSSQWQELESKAEQISQQYQCGVYLVTLEDYRDYGSYSSFWNFSQDFYTR